jgi:hypothetical protein
MAVPGKLGNEDAAMRVRDDVVMADKRLVEKTFNELISKVNLVNFGEDGGTKFILYEEQEVDKTIAERDQILKNMGVQFTKDYYKKVYYLDETDFEITNLELIIENGSRSLHLRLNHEASIRLELIFKR